MPATQLVDGVWLVGSGEVARSKSDDHDCHVYLVYDGASAVLIDAGTGLGSEAILANIDEVCPTSRVDAILCTHYHADHAGGLASLSVALQAPVAASEITARALEIGDEEQTQVRKARRAGVYPETFSLEPAPVGQTLEGGAELTVGAIAFGVVATPGHCDGHLSFTFETPAGLGLFSGDCVFRGGNVSMQAIPDCRLDAYGDTMQRLAELDLQALMPGHADIVCAGAASGVAEAARSFSRLVPAPNLLR